MNTAKLFTCCGCGCIAALLVLIVSCVAGVGGVFMYGNETLAPIADVYFANVEAERYEAAHVMLTPAARAQRTVKQFTEHEQRVKNILGSLKEKSLTGTHINTRNGLVTARLTYSAKFQHAHSDVIVNMEKIDSAWMIESVNYDTPVLADVLKCPACGKMQSSSAKFCPNCGAALKQAPLPKQIPAEATPEAAD